MTGSGGHVQEATCARDPLDICGRSPVGRGVGRTKAPAASQLLVRRIRLSTLSLSTLRRSGDLIVSIAGELDTETAGQLNTALRNPGSWLVRLVLDMRHVTRIDAVGIGAIVTADSQTRQRGQELIIVRPPADLKRWLWLTRRDEHVRVVDDFPETNGLQPRAA